MQTISQNLFDEYLKKAGQKEKFYNDTQRLCFLFPFRAKGTLMIEDTVGLLGINKYFLLSIMISFVDDRRYFEIRRIDDMSLDEYLEGLMQEKEYKSAYESLINYMQ